jgi:iron complex outermembrane receptor protein
MTNVDKSSRKGVELIFDWRITQMLRWNLNMTFSESIIDNFTEYVDDWNTWGQRSENLGKTKIAFSPQVIANNQLEFYPVKNLGIVLISNFVDKQYIDNTENNDRALDAYFLNNLKIQYSIHTKLIKDIDIHLLINNITNESYVSNAWVYTYYFNGERAKMDGLFPQAGIHFLAGLILRF